MNGSTGNARWSRGVLYPLAVGVVATALTLVSALDDPRRALLGWLAAYGFVASTVLAAMVLAMVLHVTGARWWLVLRRIFLAVVGTAPLLVVFFIPIGAASSILYGTSRASAIPSQHLWSHPAFFLTRSAIYLAAWAVIAVLLRRADIARQEGHADVVRRERTISAIGLPVIAFTLTFASFDWLLSLQPGFDSNVFGIYVFTSGLISAIAVIAIATWLAGRQGVLEGVQPDHVHAVGRLLLMALILWAYIAFFQLLLVWIADLPQEVGFYVARARGTFAIMADVVLIAGRFAIPLLLLFSRALKRNVGWLAGVAGWLLLTSAVELAWIVFPAFGTRVEASDVFPFLALPSLMWAYGAHLVAVRVRTPAPAMEAMPDSLRYRSP